MHTTVTIHQLDVNSASPLGTPGSVQVWLGPTTWVGASTRALQWVVAGGGPVVSADLDLPTPCTLAQSITLAPGRYGVALQHSGIAPAFANGDGVNQSVSTTELTMTAGGASAALFSSPTMRPRVFNGAIHYTLGGTPMPLALSAEYGAGCNVQQSTICECFPSLFSGAAVDLDRTTFRYVPNALGGYDVTRTQGALIVPPGTPPLPLGDDTISVENLPFSFPYPGGSTNNLWVCSNGYFFLESYDFADFSATEQELIDQPARLAPAWFDLNPGAVGSGGVHYEIDPSLQFVTVTFNGVWTFGTSGSAVNRFQVLLFANGTIEVRYGQIRNGGQPCVIGYSPGNGNLGLPALDVDLSAISVVQTSYSPGLRLRAQARPVLGSSLVMCTTQIPAAALVSTNLLSYVSRPLGTSLTWLGASGCMQYCDADAAAILLGTGTQLRSVGQVPLDPIWIGLDIYSQSASLVPGANALGVITSNGSAMRIGGF